MATVDRKALTRWIEMATLAPSLHNSQPWRFRVDGDTVEVYADPARRLEVLDPEGREMIISVGAALFTLRAAIRAAGRIPAVAAFPDPGVPDLVARVRPGRIAEPGPDALELAAAIDRRHTSRRPFTAAVVPADAVDKLKEAAIHEGARLAVAGGASRTVIVSLGRAAADRLRRRGGYFAELNRWTRPVPGRLDGIPAHAIGPWDALERIPMRDFGVVDSQPSRRGEEFEAFPTITVLTTVGDAPAQWLQAGQALQRILLVATRLHLATTPISQPVEIPAIRDVLSDPRTGRWAQMVIRLGYGPPAAATPRRPVTEVLLAPASEV
ncbi:nitroreductase family protein [Actinoplanes sp. LDG1-06]|uniref:Nitroreductase family protein n=1 Tax=Paractinoplanes ovalisporus TaxID=2810368 RepID=A0ABS2A986_9ACTN|nr:nitroreductase family protein [Actinoplanes ovalisporus]MBM2616396.1 nitroreductase family protein [Actinoplanes ovalisporus]